MLDKITELVEYSIQLQAKVNDQDLVVGNLEKFTSCGIITTEILSRFRSGYVPGLFMEEQLILLFKKLLIIAEIGEGNYLMPCLLKEDKSIQHSSSQFVPDLLFDFGPDGPKLGVYCFLLASLINDAKCELSLIHI